MAAPMMEQQKAQRNKAKGKEKDYKKKELRDGEFEGKGKKGRKQKPVAEEKKPQPKPDEQQEEEIKQIVIPEVLTIKELADKMKVVPSVIVKKLFVQGKVVTVNPVSYTHLDVYKRQALCQGTGLPHRRDRCQQGRPS